HPHEGTDQCQGRKQPEHEADDRQGLDRAIFLLRIVRRRRARQRRLGHTYWKFWERLPAFSRALYQAMLLPDFSLGKAARGATVLTRFAVAARLYADRP